MLGFPIFPPSRLLAVVIFVIAACATEPAGACPAGSQFFAYGGAGGCVKPGSNEVVVKCFSMGKVCPTGWSNEGQTDTGSWCCPQPVTQKIRCTWRGTAPFCDGGCRAGEHVVEWAYHAEEAHYGGFGAECWQGHKAYCCTGPEKQ
jgi:hypothetical protein